MFTRIQQQFHSLIQWLRPIILQFKSLFFFFFFKSSVSIINRYAVDILDPYHQSLEQRIHAFSRLEEAAATLWATLFDTENGIDTKFPRLVAMA